MRFRHRDGTLVHVAYCTNVHPAEDLDGVIAQFTRYARPIRDRLGVNRLGVGLWLARPVADMLTADPGELLRLRRAVDKAGLEVVTINGFPYQGFHSEVVKHDVYHPDWTQPERMRYTLDLARILTRLLPEDVRHGSISTLPVAWREPWSAAQEELARRRQDRLDRELIALASATGRSIRVAFEPEPGCLVESTAQAAQHLLGDRRFLGVCLDACHLAVGFEDPAAALDRLAAAGLPVVKLQASCALQADRPADPETRKALNAFVEPRFLHQTRERGVAAGVDDLDAALDGELPGEHEWRVHYHVPLHAEPAEPLRSTRPVLTGALETLFGGDRALTDHVEVETYTWEVLPGHTRTKEALINGIVAELTWTRDELVRLGLKEEN
ncbi:metabolite traffic protein EboE [Thermomonospora cellulosilytica]|uniref:Sugar phosphate isomerase/epimerase n=1 Tax=Thermomonospora cellulosilytica TaxID=1411118 RepID=A0A7W3R6B5_9ACTN|nr:metabolite traffic protein EboE [Thermomonospora cellulosilytica]MBA9001472.1 sugar phosphate isomerase/epimerase [Thermomonospora cellulosilytica]